MADKVESRDAISRDLSREGDRLIRFVSEQQGLANLQGKMNRETKVAARQSGADLTKKDQNVESLSLGLDQVQTQ